MKFNSDELEPVTDANKGVVKVKADDFSIDGSIDDLKDIGRFLKIKQNVKCPLQVWAAPNQGETASGLGSCLPSKRELFAVENFTLCISVTKMRIKS